MWLLIRISMRNLLRQKRRNFLLGTAIAVGVLLLVVANSFSNGLSDIMMNKVLRFVTGHVTISFNERGKTMSEIFRDKERSWALIRKADSQKVIVEMEEAIGIFTRAIGVGKTDNLILIGVDMSQTMSAQQRKETEESFRLIEGSWDDLTNPAYENPVIISADKARYLNVKMKDTIRIRMRTMNGQDQSARLTLVGIMENANIFMQAVSMLDLKNLKALIGFDAHSSGNVNLILRDPEKNAAPLADAIHREFAADNKLALIQAEAQAGGKPLVTVVAYRSEPELKPKIREMLPLQAGQWDAVFREQQAIVAAPLARQLGLKPGSQFNIQYTDKWGAQAKGLVKVGGIFDPEKSWGPQTVVMQDDRFYGIFYSHWPKPADPNQGWIPEVKHPASTILAQEWILLPRTLTTEDMEKKYKAIAKKKWKSTIIDVRTMYETGKSALQMEGVLNLITLSAVLVLLVITLIGVVNTLRMTIRERTREIGTIRAIGMQQGDVRALFLLETFFLALFASIAGVILALLVMWGLSCIPIHMSDNPMGMLLVNEKLYFLPTISAIAGNVILILVLAVGTAFFPSNRAAHLAPGQALRHIE